MAHHRSRPKLDHNPSPRGLLTEEERKRGYWSYSSLNQIANICGLQFFFQRIQKLLPEFTSDNLIFGGSVHAAASWMYRLRREGEAVKAGEIREIFAETLTKEAAEAETVKYGEGKSLDSLIEEGQGLIDVLLQNQREEEIILDVDLPFKVPLRHSSGESLPKLLVGEIDVTVIPAPGARTVVRDLKTARQRYTEEKLKHDLQASCYVYSLQQLDPKNAGSEFQWAVLLKNKKPLFVRYRTTRSQDDFDRLFTIAKTADRLIQSGAFLPNKNSFACANCAFTAACNQWNTRASSTVSLPGGRHGDGSIKRSQRTRSVGTGTARARA